MFELTLGEDFHPSEAYPAIDRAFSEAWDDPKMDDYDRYEDLKLDMKTVPRRRTVPSFADP